jgi:subtilase family serine protease
LPPKIEYFRAEPEIIEYGSCTVLEWGKVLNATEATIEPGIGGVGTPDTRVICPTETTVYTLAAIGPDGQASMSVTVTVGGALPDLTIQSVTFFPSLPVRGQDNQGQVTIYNAGDGNAGPFVWKWKAETDKVFRGRLEAGLRAGETTVISFTWRPVAAHEGLLYVAQVDVRDEVAESNDMNNRLEATIDVIDTPLGDLVLQEFGLDEDNQVMIQVANPGGRIKMPTFEYELYQDGDLVLTGSLDTPEIGHTVYATGHVITDEHEIRIVIDPADLIAESDESNNEGTLTCSSTSRSCS